MFICRDCFLDEELRSDVIQNASKDGICAVCGSRGKLMDFSEYYDFFSALLALYTPSDKSCNTIADIIQEEWNIFYDKNIANILLSDVITANGCNYSINDFVDYTDEIKKRVAVWETLKKDVREKNRFFIDIREFDKYNYLTTGASLTIKQKLYRSRVIPKEQKKIKCSEMGCPPHNLATPGRANPKGIPYLYLSDSAKTTYYEVRALYLDKLSVGTFRITRDLKLIDFIYDVNLFLSYNYSSLPLKETIIKKKIIDAISADLSKPIRRYDDPDLEYVPTQLICEYCKNIVGADGISFASSVHKGGRNYVLFDNSAAKCTRVTIHEITKIDIDRK